jgi:adenylylsulfate kinase-like enzyme
MAVIWFYGLSGAGKSTLSWALAEQLKLINVQPIVLDGDEVREIFEGNLSYDLDARESQVRRVQNLARCLDRQRILVIVNVLYATERLMQYNRQIFRQYIEIFVDAPINLLHERDTKQLYSRASQGVIKDVIGVDLEWHPPQSFDLIVNTSTHSVSESIDQIFNDKSFMSFLKEFKLSR